MNNLYTAIMHKEVAAGTLKSAIKQAEMNPEDFIKAYRNSGGNSKLDSQ